MVTFFNVLGIIFWALGMVTCSVAKGAMHETNGLVNVLIGTICLVAAALLDELRKHRAPAARPATPIPGPGDLARARGEKPKSFWSKLTG